MKRLLAERKIGPDPTAPRPDACTKVTYRSPAAAKKALRRYRSAGLHSRNAYQCHRCKLWHLTSQEQRLPGAPKPVLSDPVDVDILDDLLDDDAPDLTDAVPLVKSALALLKRPYALAGNGKSALAPDAPPEVDDAPPPVVPAPGADALVLVGDPPPPVVTSRLDDWLNVLQTFGRPVLLIDELLTVLDLAQRDAVPTSTVVAMFRRGQQAMANEEA